MNWIFACRNEKLFVIAHPSFPNVPTIFLNNLTDSPHFRLTLILSSPLSPSHFSRSLCLHSHKSDYIIKSYIFLSLTKCLQRLTVHVLIHHASPSVHSAPIPLPSLLSFSFCPFSTQTPSLTPLLLSSHLYNPSRLRWDPSLMGLEATINPNAF